MGKRNEGREGRREVSGEGGRERLSISQEIHLYQAQDLVVFSL